MAFCVPAVVPAFTPGRPDPAAIAGRIQIPPYGHASRRPTGITAGE